MIRTLLLASEFVIWFAVVIGFVIAAGSVPLLLAAVLWTVVVVWYWPRAHGGVK